MFNVRLPAETGSQSSPDLCETGMSMFVPSARRFCLDLIYSHRITYSGATSDPHSHSPQLQGRQEAVPEINAQYSEQMAGKRLRGREEEQCFFATKGSHN